MAEKPKTPDTIWPKPFLLECYKRALEEGCIELIFDGGHTEFKSFQAAFYRLRRRGDDQYNEFIEQSFHLVTCSWNWIAQAGYVIYDKMPAGQRLPRIRSVEGTAMPASTTPKQHPLPPPVDDTIRHEQEERPFDSAEMVKNLLNKIDMSDLSDDSKATELP